MTATVPNRRHMPYNAFLRRFLRAFPSLCTFFLPLAFPSLPAGAYCRNGTQLRAMRSCRCQGGVIPFCPIFLNGILFHNIHVTFILFNTIFVSSSVASVGLAAGKISGQGLPVVLWTGGAGFSGASPSSTTQTGLCLGGGSVWQGGATRARRGRGGLVANWHMRR